MKIFNKCKDNSAPFKWVQIEKCFESRVAIDLFNSFPRSKFNKSIGKEKRYKHLERTIVDGNTPCNNEDLSDVWLKLIKYFKSTNYKQMMEQKLNRSLSNSFLKVRLYRYEEGDWMNPHTDPPDRLTSHLIYLNPEWQEEYGGQLVILKSNDLKSISNIIPPKHNTGIIFSPTKFSYHAVMPMLKSKGFERKVIISQFIKLNNYNQKNELKK